jgi:single-stranded-DNA-specific exonuclease
MHHLKRWNIAPASEAAAELAASLKTSPLIAQMLLNRGLTVSADCQAFLSPSLKNLIEPSLLPNLSAAAGRIAKAIRDREKIVIYGDYDVDGITSTAILWHAIHLLGGEADFYIPHRLEEGYGLNADALGQICDAGARLIVTVDCGITAIEEAQIPRQRGVDLIITDHHEWQHKSGDENAPLLPECHSIVHPRLPTDGGYPNPSLCGAGVAFKLAWGIGLAHSGSARVSDEFRAFLVEALSLAALGTIADVVPLQGENRTLAHFGLLGLKQSHLKGIRALIESAGLTGQKLDSYHAGFLLAPRLNACGRMGHAALAVEMLTRADEARAAEIAVYLEEQNRARQTIERQIFLDAEAQVKRLGFDGDRYRGIVLAAEGWHAGVIGIVASRIVGRFNRPTVMVALANGHGQGSARSIPGFHLARALDACREHLETCGGHEMAAGLRLETGKLEAFREAFRAYAAREVSPEMLTPMLHLDCIAELGQITAPLAVDLQRLGPFGTGNRKPLLCCTDVELTAVPRRVGKSQEHLQLMVRKGNSSIKCIAFNHGHLFDRLQPGTKIDLAAEPTINEFNGRRSVELEVKDVRFPEHV